MARHQQRESHTFSRVPRVEARRSKFDCSKGYKTTFNAGLLIPFFVEEVNPGDTFQVNCNLFCRVATMLKPIMDNLYIDTQFFFVPNRLLWSNWVKMWGEQDNPGDSTDFLVPRVVAPAGASVTSLSIWDYMGIPVNVPDLWMNALYPRAYNLVYNQWYRDQNMIDSVPVETGDSDDPANYTLLRRGKRHDYFTSALPWPQKGPEVLLPIAGLAPVIPAGAQSAPTFNIDLTPSGGTPVLNQVLQGAGTGGAPGPLGASFGPGLATFGTTAPAWWNTTGLIADLGQGSSVTINDFREAVVAQQFYEMLARGGSRYVETLQNVWGVSNGDARLQRPEYLGGGRTPIMVNPVVNTAGQAGGPAQGDLAAYGVGSSGSDRHGFTKSFTEHGICLGILSVRADLNYQQGVRRQFSRRSKFDYPIPHFAHLGEQAVLNREIFAQGELAIDPGTGKPYDEGIFGYVGRYDECRYSPSQVTGLFRSEVSTGFTSVDQWHLAQDFDSLPVLSQEWIEENPPVERVVAVPTEPHFLLDSWITFHKVEELPVYSVPGLRRI